MLAGNGFNYWMISCKWERESTCCPPRRTCTLWKITTRRENCLQLDGHISCNWMGQGATTTIQFMCLKMHSLGFMSGRHATSVTCRCSKSHDGQAEKKSVLITCTLVHRVWFLMFRYWTGASSAVQSVYFPVPALWGNVHVHRQLRKQL